MLLFFAKKGTQISLMLKHLKLIPVFLIGKDDSPHNQFAHTGTFSMILGSNLVQRAFPLVTEPNCGHHCVTVTVYDRTFVSSRHRQILLCSNTLSFPHFYENEIRGGGGPGWHFTFSDISHFSSELCLPIASTQHNLPLPEIRYQEITQLRVCPTQRV